MKLLLTFSFVFIGLIRTTAQPFLVNSVSNGIWTLHAEISFFSPNGSEIPSRVPANNNGSTVNHLVFKAGEEITLKNDFEAKSNNGSATFHAYLVPPKSYAELKDKVDGSYVVTIENKLYFRYVEKYHAGDGKLDYKIYNHKNDVIMAGKNYGTLVPREITKVKGSNFRSIDLSPSLNIAGLQATNAVDCFYLLEVVNDKGDRYVLRFKYLPIL